MEAGRGLLSAPTPSPNLPRTHTRNPHATTSVTMSRDQATHAITSSPTTSIARHFPASVLSQEQQNDCKGCVLREDRLLQATLEKWHLEGGLPFSRERDKDDFDKYLKYFEQRLLYQPGLWYLLPGPYTEEKTYSSMARESIVSDVDVVVGSDPMQVEKNSPSSVIPGDVLALAKRAMVASRKAALLAEKSDNLAAEVGESNLLSLHPDESTKDIPVTERMVRSKRLLERQSKKRKVGKRPNNFDYEISSTMTTDLRKKTEKGLNLDDPLRLFLFGPETKQLLTIKEEKELFRKIEELMRLEEVKQKIQAQFNREPTLAEWAQAVGMSCQVLQSCLHSGNRSRDKMIYANFRLVIHVAKQYEGKGLNLQDLLQEGSRGLMKSLEKFKPKAGCRFPTYAYWWIRQSIRKAIFQNSRTIRLPENVFALLKKIKNARRVCIQEGHLPTNEELAKRVGIRTEKLESLLITSRNPLSIQERPWLDQDVTFQEITADPEVEIPDLTIAKQMMRQHVRNLLGVLNRRERQIIQFRYGIHDGERKSLMEIGTIYGLSKERVRQLESRALDKLKECLPSQGLEAYIDLLV